MTKKWWNFGFKLREEAELLQGAPRVIEVLASATTIVKTIVSMIKDLETSGARIMTPPRTRCSAEDGWKIELLGVVHVDSSRKQEIVPDPVQVALRKPRCWPVVMQLYCIVKTYTSVNDFQGDVSRHVDSTARAISCRVAYHVGPAGLGQMPLPPYCA
nr:hypothetical protein CFP56_26075 [Quercus suber]